MAVRIATDSACDLTLEEAAGLGIEVVPLKIRFGDEEFVDREELTVEDFFRRMEDFDGVPETAAPPPGAFEQAFRKLAPDADDTVVCINISSGVSATMQAAEAAARSLEGSIDVRVVDSRSLTGGQAAQIRAAVAAAEAGQSADDIVALVEDMATRTHVFGALDTLENLKKGGRIGGAAALAGTMLSIKPVIDVSSGEVEEAAKPRTRKKALAWIRNQVAEAGPIENLHLIHGQCPDIDEFCALIDEVVEPGNYRVQILGPVVSAHGGPRVMGVTYQSQT